MQIQRMDLLRSTTSPARILIIRVGALGDTLMVTPLLRLIHRQYPKTEIDALVSSLAAPLLKYNRHLSKIISLRGRNLPIALSLEKQRLIRQLRTRRYDLTLLLESAPRYRHLAERIAPGEIRSFREAAFDAGKHAIINFLNVAEIHTDQIDDLNMDLPLSAEDGAFAEHILRDLPRPVIGIHVGWGPLGQKKNQESRLRGWNHTNFAELIRMILEHQDASVLLTGSPEDVKDTERICRLVSNPRLHSIAGQTQIRELASVIKNLDLLVSVDSGPSHMAAALGTPLVVLWGSGWLNQTRPVSSISPIRIIRHMVPCAPCQITPLQKSCRRNICMESITTKEVFAAMQELLPGLEISLTLENRNAVPDSSSQQHQDYMRSMAAMSSSGVT
jgi:ADP-heptose:LPS heptosyltransferase